MVHAMLNHIPIHQMLIDHDVLDTRTVHCASKGFVPLMESLPYTENPFMSPFNE